AGQSKPLSWHTFPRYDEPRGGADAGRTVVHAQDQGGAAAPCRRPVATSDRTERAGRTQHGQGVSGAGSGSGAVLAACGRSHGHGVGGATLSGRGSVERDPAAAALADDPCGDEGEAPYGRDASSALVRVQGSEPDRAAVQPLL